MYLEIIGELPNKYELMILEYIQQIYQTGDVLNEN